MSNFTHLSRSEGQSRLHISHLLPYVSAYEFSLSAVDDLVHSIEEALDVARSTTTVQIVDQDGEFCLHVTPAGYIKLMVPWKTYQIVRG